MQVVKSYPDGIFCWVDLSTTDPAGAKAFYSALFGWEIEDRPIDGGGVYTMLNLGGHSVAGMGELQPEMQAQGIPSHWMSYVKHDDVDGVAERVAAAGGILLFPPMDVMDQGRMIMAQDSTGAMFGVWQPNRHTGAELVNQPNTLVWNELQTRDAAAAQAFYQAVFDWESQVDAPSGYVMFAVDGRRQAGLMQMDESWGDVPPNWAVYFQVEDVAAYQARAEELGANILVPMMPAGEMGHFAVIQDPQGAVFTIMKFNGPSDPPPGY